MSIIRKLSVGTDFPNGVMHYQVGKTMNLMGESYAVSTILKETTLSGKVTYNIYIKGNEDSILWKSVIDMPVHIEYDITFQ